MWFCGSMDDWKDGKRNGDAEEASGDVIEVSDPNGKWPGGRFEALGTVGYWCKA